MNPQSKKLSSEFATEEGSSLSPSAKLSLILKRAQNDDEIQEEAENLENSSFGSNKQQRKSSFSESDSELEAENSKSQSDFSLLHKIEEEEKHY